MNQQESLERLGDLALQRRQHGTVLKDDDDTESKRLIDCNPTRPAASIVPAPFIIEDNRLLNLFESTEELSSPNISQSSA